VEPIPETQQVLDELASHGDTDLVDLVQKMGQRAKEIVPRCVGLSLALFEDGLTFTLVASDEEVASLDAVQYLDGGPCVAAPHEEQVLDVSGSDMLSEDRWVLYAQATAAVGVASSLTLPILGDEGAVIGSVNLYAATPNAFEGHHEDLAKALGASARSAVANADLSFSTRLEAVKGPTRLTESDVVNVAVGIISASQHVDIGTARERLRQAAARAGITEEQAARAVRHTLLP
jgi:GAF domain-containing protein